MFADFPTSLNTKARRLNFHCLLSWISGTRIKITNQTIRCYYESDCILLEEANDTYTDPISLKETKNVIVDLLSDPIERDKRDIVMLIVVRVD